MADFPRITDVKEEGCESQESAGMEGFSQHENSLELWNLKEHQSQILYSNR